jgi:hypothetical protein
MPGGLGSPPEREFVFGIQKIPEESPERFE